LRVHSTSSRHKAWALCPRGTTTLDLKLAFLDDARALLLPCDVHLNALYVKVYLEDGTLLRDHDSLDAIVDARATVYVGTILSF
jgi:hypothetical protein